MELLVKCLRELNIDYDDEILFRFEKYYDLLIRSNSRINLTAITKKEDVIIKHFIDSAALLGYYDISGKTVIDVGTGAGFPGIPVRILCHDCEMVLLDSLKKRADFLNETISVLKLPGISVKCARAEDAAKNPSFRERFDVVTSRAVAGLNTLAEYCLPFVNIGGYFISYKGSNISDELSDAKKAISVFGGVVDKVESFVLPSSDIKRTLIFVRKTERTPDRYPRKAGIPLKRPL